MQIKSNGLRVALFGIAGALIAASTLAINDYYVCSAVLNVRDTNAVSTVIQQALARRSLWPIIAKNGLYESDRNHIPNEDIIEKFRHAIFIKPIQNQQAITVSYHGPDRVIAKTVTEDLAQIFLRDSRNIGALVEISLPQRRGGHKRIFIFFEGLCVGLFAGACYVRLMAMRRAA